ncbi:MAG TPA: ATP-binding protein [Candidatus Nitrosopolaris sp.]|nr:ATP-binding protein [Candidatus Nitrosopolaris sp.]
MDFSKRIKEIGIISIIIIIVFSFGLLFYVQNITKTDIKNNLLLQQKQRQVASTRDISLHIGSDLNLVVGMLDGLANSVYLQQGDLSSGNATKLVSEKYVQFSKVINGLFLLDKNNIVTLSFSHLASEGAVLGADYSLRDWVTDTRQTLKPVFSDGFERQGVYTIFISYPVVSRLTGQYLGTVATSISTVPFLAHYGNVEHVNTQFLVAYDTNGTMLANGAGQTFVGQNFFGNYTQQFIKHNAVLNNLTRTLLAASPGVGMYDYGRGERLTTGYPIFVNGKPTYFIQVVTPTTQIYSGVNGLLSTEDVKMFTLLGSTFAAISVLIIILFKWSTTLNKEVNRRTSELDLSNRQLAIANKKLKVQDEMQKEFINIAAHELRTPIQPIIGLSEILRSRKRGYVENVEAEIEENEFLDVIIRNAKRLRNLSEDILDVTKIESQSLVLKKERFNLNQLILDAIADSKNQFTKGNKDTNIKIETVLKWKSEIYIKADKSRIYQVFSNLLGNAIKFTKAGTIIITTEKSSDVPETVVVTIKDSGIGIDPKVLPKLFTKFTTNSQGGSGLGLFISKSIIEAHGGRIWTESNNDDKGATFRFILPVE